jgi:cytochrome c peroxidase
MYPVENTAVLNRLFSRKLFIVLFYISTWICVVGFYTPAPGRSARIYEYYRENLDSLKQSLTLFHRLCRKQAPAEVLKKHFYQCRLVYKQIAVLSGYYNRYETTLLNGPPLARTEPDNPDHIIGPQGFQVIEELIFSKKYNTIDYAKIGRLLTGMEQVVAKLKKEFGGIYPFRDALVWDAMRSSLVEIMAMGLTGFDSPIAGHSIPESRASLVGVKKILVFYKPLLDESDPGGYEQIEIQLNKCFVYLDKNTCFNDFDRMHFIVNYLNPLFKIVVHERIKCGIQEPDGKSPLHAEEESIFNTGAFDINFYSPPKEYWVNPERVQLGRMLFSDPILSGSHSRSCASCHKPEKGFTDGLARPYALDNKTHLERNTPTLLNAGFQTNQFYDSRADMLENQVTDVVHNAREMGGSLKKSVTELKGSPVYGVLFEKAYPAEKKPINAFTIANAISSYIRSLRSLSTRFDLYMRGNRKMLAKGEIEGFNLFMGKAKCGTCHFIPLFNGVAPPFFNETESDVLGIPQSAGKDHPLPDSDLGKYNFSGSAIDKRAFKTPTLRNIVLTAPYMHNGIYNSLEEVVEFYNKGGGKGLNIGPENQTLPFDRLHLTPVEMNKIISFLKTLTDTSSFRIDGEK